LNHQADVDASAILKLAERLVIPVGVWMTGGGLGHRSARWVSLWSAATRRRFPNHAATSRRTPHWVG